jgi:hypothetical protein
MKNHSEMCYALDAEQLNASSSKKKIRGDEAPINYSSFAGDSLSAVLQLD